MAGSLSVVTKPGDVEYLCIDTHCAGLPARVVFSGHLLHCGGQIPGDTCFEKRSYFMEHLDFVRQALMLEPRGYPGTNLDFIIPKEELASGLIGYIIAEQSKVYPLMSGHNTIGVVTALVQSGFVKTVDGVNCFDLECPGGVIKIEAECMGGKALQVKFMNMPSFPAHHDVKVDVPELGIVTCDVVFGGMWYCIVDVEQFGRLDDIEVRDQKLPKRSDFRIRPENGAVLTRYGEMIKVACQEQMPVKHPNLDGYTGPDILVFQEKAPYAELREIQEKYQSHGVKTADDQDEPAYYWRNAVIMSVNELKWGQPETYRGFIDRSPCGTGTCALTVNAWSKGLLSLGETFENHSIIGTRFLARIEEEVSVVPKWTTSFHTNLEENIRGVTISVQGRAWVTGINRILVDVDDPFQRGYTVGDIWGV